jgi:GNAT superfamily N-acetyltransferase
MQPDLATFGPFAEADEELMAEMVPVYTAVHPECGQDERLLEGFLRRTRSQMLRPGFRLVIIRTVDQLVGFSLGLTFPAGSWWSGAVADPPPDEILQADKFAVIELNVAPEWQGHGLGTVLMDALLADRTEPYAMLTTNPASKARSIYEHWGWTYVGRAHHAPEQEVMDELVLALRAAA